MDRDLHRERKVLDKERAKKSKVPSNNIASHEKLEKGEVDKSTGSSLEAGLEAFRKGYTQKNKQAAGDAKTMR